MLAMCLCDNTWHAVAKLVPVFDEATYIGQCVSRCLVITYHLSHLIINSSIIISFNYIT